MFACAQRALSVGINIASHRRKPWWNFAARKSNTDGSARPLHEPLLQPMPPARLEVLSPSLVPFELHAGDALAFLRTLKSSSVDLVITDPPYESLEKHRKIGTTTRLSISKGSNNPWFGIFPNSRFEELFREIHRVLKKDSHFYLFCDAETMFVAKPIAESAGFHFWKPIIWDKVHIGMGYHYRSQCERILFFEKGKRRLNDLGVPDILRAPRIRGGYPTEKPSSIIEILVKQSSLAGELVADPFMGAGSTGVAALTQNRRFIGNDISRVALELATERLSRAKVIPSDRILKPDGGGTITTEQRRSKKRKK